MANWKQKAMSNNEGARVMDMLEHLFVQNGWPAGLALYTRTDIEAGEEVYLASPEAADMFPEMFVGWSTVYEPQPGVWSGLLIRHDIGPDRSRLSLKLPR